MDPDDFDTPPALPPAVEAYLAQEREWWGMLRATGAMTEARPWEESARWLE